MNHTLANDILIITPDVANLDVKYAVEFKEKVIQLITESEANNVVLDLNQVQFIDSAGLGSLCLFYGFCILKEEILNLQECTVRLKQCLSLWR